MPSSVVYPGFESALTTEANDLDVLANNAGVMALQDKATTDGFDLQMQTNHLSHFLLAKELYPAVKAAAAARGEARIVHHSSISRTAVRTRCSVVALSGCWT